MTTGCNLINPCVARAVYIRVCDNQLQPNKPLCFQDRIYTGVGQVTNKLNVTGIGQIVCCSLLNNLFLVTSIFAKLRYCYTFEIPASKQLTL